MQITFAEEGSATLRPRKKKWIAMRFEWSRGVDVTDYIPSEIASKLEEGKYKIGTLKKELPEILRYIEKVPPRLLFNEYNELIRRHSHEVDPDLWPTIHISEENVAKNGRITAIWRFATTKQKLVNILAEQYGMPHGTWKEHIFKIHYKFYKEYVGRPMTAKEYEKCMEIKKKYSYKKMSKEWIYRKLKEYFDEEYVSKESK
jgi:hypothetical protein